MDNIAIIGTGYVGLSTAAILANVGYKVWTVDIDESKIQTIKKGKSYFYEPGIDSFIESGIKKGNLISTVNHKEALQNCKIIFSCVGTPDLPDGSTDLRYVFDVARIVANHSKDQVIFVQKSTVPVGTGREIIDLVKKINPNLKFSYISNPEFLREGSAIYDTLHADRVVIGGGDENAKIKIIEVFKNVDEFKNTVDTQNFQEYAKTYITDDNGKGNFVSKLVLTSIESAELIKVTANAFLALKISFANSIALLCDETGANINEVMDGLGLDRRISRSFLYAGLGWGGGCFPKDVSGLMSTFKAFGLSNPILDGAVQVNDFMPEFVTQKVLKINKSKVAILGLSFKPGTSDVRKSQSIKLANTLAKHKLYVFAFDPQANEEARRDLDTSIKICKSIEEAVEQAEIIVIATEWNEFKNINWKKLSKQTKARVVIDARNALNRKELKSAGFNYQGVGIGEV